MKGVGGRHAPELTTKKIWMLKNLQLCRLVAPSIFAFTVKLTMLPIFR